MIFQENPSNPQIQVETTGKFFFKVNNQRESQGWKPQGKVNFVTTMRIRKEMLNYG